MEALKFYATVSLSLIGIGVLGAAAVEVVFWIS